MPHLQICQFSSFSEPLNFAATQLIKENSNDWHRPHPRPNGKIGTHAIRAFTARGWEIRRYTRGTDMTAAAIGADVIVNGLNPPKYHDWANQIPAITRQVIAAAKASGATVIVPGNVYVYGGPGGTWDETTPHRATSRKGRIRIEMEQAYRASGVQTIILRGGNFIDPDRNGDLISLVTLPDPSKGRVTSLGDPAALQAWVWLPDWAEAAAQLAERRAELATFEDVPMPGLSLSTNDLAAALTRLSGRTYRVKRFPWPGDAPCRPGLGACARDAGHAGAL